MSLLAWMMQWAIAAALGYGVGWRRGWLAGDKHGYRSALERAIAIERPLSLLRRIVVPRPEGD